MITRPILLVEDEPNDVFFVQHALELAKVTNVVHVTSDGQEALDYLGGVGLFADRSKYPLPYLVLLDLKLPRVMGLDVLKWIRQRKELAVIVIVLTSSRQHEDLAAAYRLGVNAYLVKSPDLSTLKEMATAIKDFWLIHNFPPPQPFSGAEMISAFATTANLGSASTL
jgi:CheY-like chemotaxis protein